MKKIVIGDIVSRAWDLAVKHWPIFVVLAVINGLFGDMGVSVDKDAIAEIQSISDPTLQLKFLTEAIQTNSLLILIGVLISTCISFIAYRMYVNCIKEGKPYNTLLDALKVDFNQLAIFFCVTICYAIIVGLGTCFCILPGIFFGIRLWFAPLIAATENVGFGEAFSRSWNATRGNFWSLFLLGITMFGIAILGLCACCVGIFFASVIIDFMEVLAYYVLRGDETPEVTTDYVEVQ